MWDTDIVRKRTFSLLWIFPAKQQLRVTVVQDEISSVAFHPSWSRKSHCVYTKPNTLASQNRSIILDLYITGRFTEALASTSTGRRETRKTAPFASERLRRPPVRISAGARARAFMASKMKRAPHVNGVLRK